MVIIRVPTIRLPPTCRTISTILIWYSISASIIFATKWLFDDRFPFPLTVTTYSNGLTSLWALLAAYCSSALETPTKQQFLGFVLPIGVLTALEISCSNLALKLLTVSFGTILKGGGPVFTFFWGLVLRLEVFNGWVALALVTIAGGIALASLGETEGPDDFNVAGFILQVASVALSGLRWALTHKMLLNEKKNEHSSGEIHADNGESVPEARQPHEQKQMSPLTAVLFCSPMTTICVLPVALAVESREIFTKHYDSFGIVLMTMTAIATLVFLLLMSEYWLVNATSSLALSVAGVFKELLTIAGGLFLFSEHVDALNAVGFVVCQFGILGYCYLRYDPKADQQTYTPVEEADGVVVLSAKVEEVEDDEVELSGSRFSID